jgi:putative oxidoreductase
MAVITFRLQFENGFFWTTRGYEFALLLTLACVAYLIGGGGRYSLDRVIGREF